MDGAHALFVDCVLARRALLCLLCLRKPRVWCVAGVCACVLTAFATTAKLVGPLLPSEDLLWLLWQGVHCFSAVVFEVLFEAVCP